MPERSCPICHTPSSSARMFMKQNIDPTKLSSFSFASRKLPEFMCHQLLQCTNCDLVYANDPPDQSLLAHAYHVSDFDSNQEADDAALAYARAIQPVLRRLKRLDSALEIGTGTGVFLDHLKQCGFQRVAGVEPSSAAIAAAPEHRRAWIHEGIFREEDHAPESYDLICCFMTLEHVLDPNTIVSAAGKLLRPGGAIALVTHDYRSWVNRLLGKRSPIIDIEHMQLFSQKSIHTLLELNRFNDIQVHSFHNRYTLRYWARLLPAGTKRKQHLINTLTRLGLVDHRLSFNVGNMLSYGYRPTHE